MCRVERSNARATVEADGRALNAGYARATTVAGYQEPNLDRLSALVDAAASRADDPTALFDFVIAISDLWERLGLRDPFVDAQLGDAATRHSLTTAAREHTAASAQERERLAFYALRTLAGLQRVVDAWRTQPPLRTAGINR